MTTIGRDLLVVLPNYSGLEHPTRVLLASLQEAGCPLLEAHGIGLIDRVRSELASRALETQYERWLWLDADMTAPVGELARLVETATRHDLDALTAVYMTKERPSSPTCRFDYESPAWPTPNRGAALCGADGMLYPVTMLGFGAVVTHRRLFERLRDTLPEVDLLGCKNARPYFLPMVVGRRYLGEDYSLCERARASGSTLWADSRVRVGHVGRYVYGWEDAAKRGAFSNVELTW